MPQLRQPLSSWSKRRSSCRSWKIASSFARDTGGASLTGSPMKSWTRVVLPSAIPIEAVGSGQSAIGASPLVAYSMLPNAHCLLSIRQHLAVAFHHFLDHVGTANDPRALRDEVVLGHVEQVEVRRAAIELNAG